MKKPTIKRIALHTGRLYFLLMCCSASAQVQPVIKRTPVFKTSDFFINVSTGAGYGDIQGRYPHLIFDMYGDLVGEEIITSQNTGLSLHAKVNGSYQRKSFHCGLGIDYANLQVYHTSIYGADGGLLLDTSYYSSSFGRVDYFLSAGYTFFERYKWRGVIHAHAGSFLFIKDNYHSSTGKFTTGADLSFEYALPKRFGIVFGPQYMYSGAVVDAESGQGLYYHLQNFSFMAGVNYYINSFYW